MDFDFFTDEEWAHIKALRYEGEPDYSDLFPDEDKPQEFHISGGRGYQAISGVLPNAPLYRDIFGTAVFSSAQLQWCTPEDLGFTEPYLVVEDECDAHPLALEYEDEIKLPKKRPIHKYCRKERFKAVLRGLMGQHGTVPQEILDAVRPFVNAMRLMDEEILWDFTRSILKKAKGRKYYNKIPIILATLRVVPLRIKQCEDAHDAILDDFIALCDAWKSLETDRKYFINFRYVCLRLMQKHGIVHPYSIPLLRTDRKKLALDQIFDELQSLVSDKKSCS